MLFPYVYVPHQIEKMQEFIDYIFFEVWCKAPDCDYSFELFNGNRDLKEVIFAFDNSDKSYADSFISKMQDVFELFKTYDVSTINQLKQYYRINNSIEDVCANNPGYVPVRYMELDKDLAEKLGSFFKRLYDRELLESKVLAEKIGKLDTYYKEFMTINNVEVCPYCGISPMKGLHHTKREAFDHFFPKSKYPFNSINFKNLAPMCHTCNSSYKTTDDPVFDKSGNRRKAFYTYMKNQPDVNITLEINNSTIKDLEPKDLDLEIDSEVYNEEVKTWIDLFGIEERYKAKFTNKTSKYWYFQISFESKHYKIETEEVYNMKINAAENDPYADDNFFRKPFLEACEKAGLFDKRLLQENPTV